MPCVAGAVTCRARRASHATRQGRPGNIAPRKRGRFRGMLA